MAFDAASLLSDLFPEQPPARAPAEPEEARRAPPSAASPAPARPANRLPGALPSPPLPEWLLLWRRAPEVTLPPKPCYWCRSPVFWFSTLGAYRCGNCHPPAYPGLAAMWLRVVPTEDGPQVVKIGTPPSKE